MYHEQTVWISERATGFTDICHTCEEEHPELAGSAAATVTGLLRIDADHGWATCARGHEVRVLRMSGAMPAGALR
jgi:hypothetical protein